MPTNLDPDLITLVAISGCVLLGAGAVLVAYRALGHADRQRDLAGRMTTRAMLAEGRASRYHALLSTRPDLAEPAAGPPTADVTRRMHVLRHEPPVSAGGPIRSQARKLRDRTGETNGT